MADSLRQIPAMPQRYHENKTIRYSLRCWKRWRIFRRFKILLCLIGCWKPWFL